MAVEQVQVPGAVELSRSDPSLSMAVDPSLRMVVWRILLWPRGVPQSADGGRPQSEDGGLVCSGVGVVSCIRERAIESAVQRLCIYMSNERSSEALSTALAD